MSSSFKQKRLFSFSEDEKEDTPELITLEEEEQKEIDAFGNDTEDEMTPLLFYIFIISFVFD